MEFVSYNAELGISNLLFQRVLNNIQIERTDSKGQSSWLKVPCIFSQRSRILKGLENSDRKAMYKLPLICINRTGYTRQGDRLNGLHNEVKYEITSKNRNYELLTPVPIDISYDVSIIAKYQADIDKIASNFMVFFNSNIYVSQEHPKYQGVKLHNEIIMSDGVSEDHPDEFDGSQDDIVTSTFQFTFKTYLFGGTKKAQKRPGQEISSVISTFISSYVYEFENDDEVRSYLSSDPHNRLSTIIEKEVTEPITVLVDTSSDTYDDGIPAIRNIDIGFYAVPKKEDIDQYIISVDSELIVKHEHYTSAAYISSEGYIPEYDVHEIETETGELSTVSVLTSLTPVNDWYEPVDNWCTLAPYVDRIRWRIDETSTRPFPENVRPYPDEDPNPLKS